MDCPHLQRSLLALYVEKIIVSCREVRKYGDDGRQQSVTSPMQTTTSRDEKSVKMEGCVSNLEETSKDLKTARSDDGQVVESLSKENSPSKKPKMDEMSVTTEKGDCPLSSVSVAHEGCQDVAASLIAAKSSTDNGGSSSTSEPLSTSQAVMRPDWINILTKTAVNLEAMLQPPPPSSS